MEERILKIEKELAIMASTQNEMKRALEEISQTLKEMLKLHTDTQLMRQKIESMDREVSESFKRVHKRTDKLEDNVRWVVRTIIGSLLTGFIGIMFYVIKTIAG
ncbi:hemolysin XhlA family protein [Nitrosophilus kaiyonis]|uniref:hemolysin XhlA family protein n=1 Tax=Nitrosophilus kaiyonis TaxID=2930200 RepID=UPI0024915DE2|nr:hemolysin XhlA family protein [Nitrosophilus kaiyonis]